MDKLKDEDVFGAYSHLLTIIENLFETIEFTKLQSFCFLKGIPLPQEFKKQVTDAKNLNDIMILFDNTIYCNLFNVCPLKRIVSNMIASNICNQEIEKAIDTYEDHVHSSKISIINKHLKKRGGDEKSVSKIDVEINMSHEDSTVKQIIDCNRGLEKLMKIYAGAISTTGSRPGCLRITVIIPLHCSLHAFEMAKKNFIMLRQYHIQYLEFESFSTKVFAFNCCNDDTILSSNVPKCEFHLKCYSINVRINVCMYVRMYDTEARVLCLMPIHMHDAQRRAAPKCVCIYISGKARVITNILHFLKSVQNLTSYEYSL